MALQSVAVEFFYDAAWNDVVASPGVFEGSITIRQGMGDEAGGFRPAQITAQLNNADDRFRVSNPASVLYGKIGRNTPVRVKVGGTVRGIAEASSWSADQTQDFRVSPARGKAWVDLTAGGLLQRIGQWTQKLKSPFRQYNETISTSIGYWPGEQARGSTDLQSVTPGVTHPVFLGMAPDSQFRPPSSEPLLDMPGDDAEVAGNFVRNGSSTATTGWQLSWVARYGTFLPGAAGDNIMDWATTDGTQYSVVRYADTGRIGLASASSAGTVVLNSSVADSGYDWSQWTLFSVDAQYSAGTTTVWLNWTNADGSKSGFMNAAFTGVPASLLWWDMNVFEGVPAGSTIGHVLGVPASSLAGPDNLFSLARQAAWFGYAGETAADRFSRLCGQLNVPFYVSANYAKSLKMGPQGTDSFVNLLKEIVATDDALLFDHAVDARLYLLLRPDRQNQTPRMTLTPTDFPAIPREVTDDLATANIITMSQRDGVDVTVQDTTGPLGTQPPPAGVGEARQSFDVCLASPGTDLTQLGVWYLRRGTVAVPRFPTLTLDLNANPGLITAAESVTVGSVLVITGLREYTVRLYVVGWTEVIDTHARTITFNCAPDQQFNVGKIGTDRLAAKSTTLNAGITAGATSLTLKMTDVNEQWRTGNNAVPVLCGGELITLGTVGAVKIGRAHV